MKNYSYSPKKFIFPLKCRKLLTQKLIEAQWSRRKVRKVQTLGSITFVDVSYTVQPTILDCPMATTSSQRQRITREKS